MNENILFYFILWNENERTLNNGWSTPETNYGIMCQGVRDRTAVSVLSISEINSEQELAP